LVSPKKSLATYSKSKVTQREYRIFKSVCRNLSSEYAINRIKDEYLDAATYEIHDDFVRLKGVYKAVSWRLSRIPEDEKSRILIMCDKSKSMILKN
jgi:hypothetical protein